MSAEKTPGISAIDTTNFARQIVLDFEFAPVPRQRQRRGLRNEIIEVGAVKLDNRGNVMGEFSQFVQTEFTEGVAFPGRELTGISAVDTAMADPLCMVIKRLGDWIGRYFAQIVCWSGTDRRQLLTECQAKHIDLSAFPTDWADLQAFYTSIMDVGSHGRVSLGDAATWFGIEFDDSTGHAHSALADARVTAKLLKQVMDGDYRVSPRAQEIRQRWGMGERVQTRLSSKCPELGDLLLKLKAEGGQGATISDGRGVWGGCCYQCQFDRTNAYRSTAYGVPGNDLRSKPSGLNLSHEFSHKRALSLYIPLRWATPLTLIGVRSGRSGSKKPCHSIKGARAIPGKWLRDL